MKIFVTGGAGFIGSNLVDRLLHDRHEVVAYDDFCTGQREVLEHACNSDMFRLVEGDVLDLNKLGQAMAGCEFVFHLAANADVRFGTEHPRKDLDRLLKKAKTTFRSFHILVNNAGVYGPKGGIEDVLWTTWHGKYVRILIYRL